jgi:sarcosine oxidase subunit beta
MDYRSDLPRTADLVIVGGGVVGAATAWHAARAGYRPVVLEARPAICTLTTPVAAGAFRLQFDNLEELELVRESVELFLNFEEATRQRTYALGVRQQGYLWLTTSEETAAVQHELVRRLHGWGQTDVELLTGDEARARFPFVGPEVIQARFRQGDGFLHTKRLTYGLAASAVASGASVVANCRATGFVVRSGRVAGVETTLGTIETDTAVVAAGPLSGPLAAAAGIELPVVTVRRHKLWVPDAPAIRPDAPMTIDEDTGAHWRPFGAGAWVLFTDPATPPEPPAWDVRTEASFAFRVMDPASPVSVARVTPLWQEMWEFGAHHWLLQAGQYTVTPDHRPLIGPTEIEGLYANTGYSGHGIMLSPAGSRLLVDVMTSPAERATNPFAPDREFGPVPPPRL